MPLHFASVSSSSSSAKPRRLPQLNIMRSLSLCRKSRPTCTLSLAHVSACKPEDERQGDSLQLDLSTIHFVAVPMPQVPSPPRRRPAKTTTTTTMPNDINVIPFPTSTQTTSTASTSPAGSPTISHTQNSFKRPQLQKKEDLDHPSPFSLSLSSSLSPPRKRARKGSLTPPPSSPSRSTPSPRARALAQRVPPLRPSTPTPDSQSDNDMSVGDKSPVQPSSTIQDAPADADHHHQPSQRQRDLEKHGHTDLPPYSPDPPPYSPLVVAPIPIAPPIPIPLRVPIPLSSSSSPPTSASASPAGPPSPPPRLPPSSSPSPPPQRRSRIPLSELRFFIFLYRTLISGLETRQKHYRSNTPVRRARDGSRREQHLDGVLIEVDDDDIDIDVDVDVDMKAVDTKDCELTTPALKEDLEAQDALLALRLRGFLKWNGVDEWMLKVDSPSSPPPSSTCTTGVNPFLVDGNQMDVDVPHPPLPILSSRHLITVLRMRGTCGPRHGGGGPIGPGMKNRGEKSKLRMCLFKAGEIED